MDAHPTFHPTDQTLRSYGLGKLDDGSAEAVHKHLEQCPGCRNRVFVVDIGALRLKRGFFGGTRNPLTMSRGDPGRQALTGKMARNAPSEKSRPSKHRHNSISHLQEIHLSCSHRIGRVDPGSSSRLA